MNTVRKISGILLLAGTIAVTPLSQARILTDEEAAQAATSVLQDEARLFSTIRMGIALSMAQCEGRESCTPSANTDELKRLLNTLNSRIEDLTLKQESVEDPDAFQEVLAVYVDERDNYNSVLEKLGAVEEAIKGIGVESEVVDFEEPQLEDTISTDETFVDEPTEAATSEEEFQIFEDADLELKDDASLQELEDEVDPAEPVEPQ